MRELKMTEDGLKTPLYNRLLDFKPSWALFGGYLMPMYYKSTGGAVAEHLNVRANAGLFDASHMGEFRVTGDDAQKFLDGILTNSIADAKAGKCIYSLMCNEQGGVIDDLIVYKESDSEFMVVVNAGSHMETDLNWMKKHAPDDVLITNETEDVSLLALQGPKAVDVITSLCGEQPSTLKFMSFLKEVDVGGVNATVSRTGYTGEDGFELYVPSAQAVEVFNMLLTAGKDFNVEPAGLTARDTLRLESGLMLSGVDIKPDITPLEAGLDFAVKLDKSFIGSDVLLKQKEHGLERTLVGLIAEKTVPGEDYKVTSGDTGKGFVTSLRLAPSLRKEYGPRVRVGLAYVTLDIGYGDNVLIEGSAGKSAQAKVVKPPFIKKNK